MKRGVRRQKSEMPADRLVAAIDQAIDQKMDELRVLRDFVIRGQAAQAAVDTIIKREERKIRRARAGS